MHKAVKWVGHRGLPARFPENTLPSMLAACKAGVAGVECDIQLTADGVPVLLHDASLLRTGGFAKTVFELAADEVERVPVGEPERFGEQFAGVTVPRLAAVAEALASWPEVTAFVELKAETLAHFSGNFFVQQVWQALAPIKAQVVIISFELELLRLVQAQAWCRVGWVLHHYNKASLDAVQEAPVDYLISDTRKLPAAPELPWPGPWQWFVYDVVDAAVAQDCLARGIGWLETWDAERVKSFT